MTKSEIPELRKLRRDYDRARKRLFDGIRRYLERGHGPTEIGRSAGYSREYIAKIRDGKAGEDI